MTSNVDMSMVTLTGGEHLDTPALSADPGWARFTRNYEMDTNGRYRRIDGYERYDGQSKPSEASYWILNFDQGSAAMAQGDTVTGVTSSATGTLISVVLSSGSYAGGDAAGYLVLSGVSGTYQDNENLQVSAVTEAVANGTASEKGASTSALDDTYLQSAMEYWRDQIAAVPGSGSLLGIWQYSGTKYAFRNNAAGTATAMYKSSTSGWTLCSLGESLAFNTGTAAFVEGETVTEGGVSATVRRVVVTSGAWADNDAAGYFTISGRSGGNFSAGAITGSVSGSASATGVQTTNAFSVPSGRFEFVNHNFGGHSSTRRMYGCDGKNKAFEWDGTYFTPITTGMATDTPDHINVHHNHLVLSFDKGSDQHSSQGDPFTWSVVTGASEIGTGDDCVGLFILPNDVLCVKDRNTTGMIYGSATTGDDAFYMKIFSREAGAIEWSGQVINNYLVTLDDRGLSVLETTEKYGNFASSTISKNIQPYLKTKLDNVQCSCIARDKNQYRLFFDDGEGVYLTMDGTNVVGFTRVKFDDIPLCMCSNESSTGEEEIFFGDSSGMVYQLDSGYNFDGGAIESYVRFHYNHVKSPRLKKRIRKMVLELDTPEDVEISLNIEFDYGASLASRGQALDVAGVGGIYGIDTWNNFIWSGQDVGTAEAYIDGTGGSFSPLIYSSLTYEEPHTLQGYIIYYTKRGLMR